MLFNEPKLLKFRAQRREVLRHARFSALQRAEIAEIPTQPAAPHRARGFSALQRAEIAEMEVRASLDDAGLYVSVLFNEPKLLKW